MFKIPEIRICVTNVCNLKCTYCRPSGEGDEAVGGPPVSKVLAMARVAHAYGVRRFRITGGEPTLRRDLVHIVAAIKALPDAWVSMVTNGTRLTPMLTEALKAAGMDQVTISLDSVDGDRFRAITGVNAFHAVAEALDNAQAYGLPCQVNAVVLNGVNDHELIDLIRFVGSKGASIKFLDLFNVGDTLYGEDGIPYWETRYYNLALLRERLASVAQETEVVYPTGGLGTPMHSYLVEGTRVLVKDNTVGTNYAGFCRKCPLFPCQPGILSLILTAAGKVKFCPPDGTPTVPLMDVIEDEAELHHRFGQAMEMLSGTQFDQLWSPELERQRLSEGMPKMPHLVMLEELELGG
jgi:cyclic pyranopterin phosphate synthase